MHELIKCFLKLLWINMYSKCNSWIINMRYWAPLCSKANRIVYAFIVVGIIWNLCVSLCVLEAAGARSRPQEEAEAALPHEADATWGEWRARGQKKGCEHPLQTIHRHMHMCVFAQDARSTSEICFPTACIQNQKQKDMHSNDQKHEWKKIIIL